jgi:hypothetical protein
MQEWHSCRNSREPCCRNEQTSPPTPPSGFAFSLSSMGRAAVPPNHGTTAPQRHTRAASRRGCRCTHCCWFAHLGGQNKRNRIIERRARLEILPTADLLPPPRPNAAPTFNGCPMHIPKCRRHTVPSTNTTLFDCCVRIHLQK